ncbi:MAG: hypothetical protein ACRD2W_10695 [Acidimicrobiales bacterium]
MLRRREKRWAAIFADELADGCERLLAAYGDQPSLTLPISVPIDDRGVVLLRPDGPLDAPRVPATLHVERTSPGHHAIAIERQDGGHLTIPGIRDAGATDARLHTLTADITRRGLVLSGGLAALRYDEETARSYANALFLTLGRKLASAPHA